MESTRDQKYPSFSYGHCIPDDDFDYDSELGEDVDIDETGNVLHTPKVPRLPSSPHQSRYPDVLAHILAGYGTEICEQVIGEFLKLRLDNTKLSELGDEDLKKLGIRDSGVRVKMLADFALLPSPNDKTEDLCQRLNANVHNAEALANIVKHMGDLKSSIGSILMTMCQKSNENILLDEQRYNSTLVLTTMDEFYRTVTQMEAKVLELQYKKPSNCVAPKSKRSILKHVFWLGLVGVSGAFLIKIFRPALLKRL